MRGERLAARGECPALGDAPRGVERHRGIRGDTVFLLADVSRHHLALCMGFDQRDAEAEAHLEAIGVEQRARIREPERTIFQRGLRAIGDEEGLVAEVDGLVQYLVAVARALEVVDAYA